MKKTAIRTDGAPAAFGPYSQAIRAGSTLYISGQIGFDPVTMKMVHDTCVKAQTVQCLKNIQAILLKAGGSMQNVVSCTVLLADINDFEKVNSSYAEYFPPLGPNGEGPAPPARACFAAKTLPKNALVEIVAVAHLE